MLRRVIRDETGEVGAPERSPTERTTDFRKQLTLRKDWWWVPSLITVVVLGAFVAYGTWAAFQGRNFYAEPYLSPFYSPCLGAMCDHATLGFTLSWWTLSPALLILPAPMLFRLTCYYYRKAYYRAFWWAPPACSVADAGARYTGESRFPLIFQNVHRYAFYIAAPYPFILLWDAILGTQFPDGFGVGLGTVILTANAVLLGLYTFSCHSCRHLCGGNLDRFSRSPVRYKVWKVVSKMNTKHMQIAWVSLIFVAFSDVYVRLLAMGVISDVRFF